MSFAGGGFARSISPTSRSVIPRFVIIDRIVCWKTFSGMFSVIEYSVALLVRSVTTRLRPFILYTDAVAKIGTNKIVFQIISGRGPERGQLFN